MKRNVLGNKGFSKIIIEVIGAVIVIILLIFVINSLLLKTRDYASESTCRGTVALRDKAVVEVGIFKEEFNTPLLCSTKDVGLISGDREQVKKQIAELAAWCWYQYYEGRVVDLFRSDPNTRQCNVCYIFEVGQIKEGKASSSDIILTEKEGRPKNLISRREFMNFMMIETYNPTLSRGGGSRTTIGDIYGTNSGEYFSFELKIDNPIEKKTKEIKSNVIDSFIIDYSGNIDAVSIQKINLLGAKMLENKKANLLVVVADEFDSVDRVTARDIIKRVGLNTDSDNLDALLIMVDLNNEKVRVQMGLNLEPYIAEEEIKNYIHTAFGMNANTPGEALVKLVDSFAYVLVDEERMKIFSELGINPRSYYAYLSNRINYPVIFDDFENGRTYAIAFSSDTKKLTFWSSKWAIIHDIFTEDDNDLASKGEIPFIPFSRNAEKENSNNLMIGKINEMNNYCTIAS